MKKICFVCYGNLYLAPYIKNYLESVNSKCDVIVWNRHSMQEISEHNIITYNAPTDDNVKSKYKKLKGYIGFSFFTIRQLVKINYDVVIFLQSVGAICTAPLLLTKYRKKFVIDVRDYSIEGNFVLKYLEGLLMDCSKLNVISSEGYKSFLPKGKQFCLVHNYSEIDNGVIDEFQNRPIHYPIRLSYIGLIRFQEQNKKLIDLFANDSRFQLQFIGKNAFELKKYIEERGVQNVLLIDQFPSDKTLDYYKQTDAILNVYGNHTPLLDYALSNKLYFAAALRIPILVSKDTYMEKKAVNGGFGFAIDFDDVEMKDKLYSYLTKRNKEELFQSCDKFMLGVRKDNQIFLETIKKILN